MKRAGWLIAVICYAGAAGLRAAEPAPPVVVWKLDSLTEIGGRKPVVEGAPLLVRDAAGTAALEFDGRDDGLVLPVNPLAGQKQFTIEILFKPAADGATEQRFFHAQDVATRRALVEIRLNKVGGWWLDTFLRSTTGTGLALIDPKKVHPADHWYWVALRYDGQRMSSFVNGEKELEGPLEFDPMGAGEVSLGVRLNRVFWFKGAIREVRFHASAIDPSAFQRVRE